MKHNDWIHIFSELGQWLLAMDEQLQALVKYASMKNAWFTEDNINLAIEGIASMLQRDQLQSWLDGYSLATNANPRRVGAILAGNIPMVGFHDVLCILCSENIAVVKLSDKDDVLLRSVFDKLSDTFPVIKERLLFVEKLKGIDAVIATGSNQSASYFEEYFGKYPNIIRRNRNSIAILDGNESPEDLKALGKDIFSYYGLGCRNVSKLLVPEGYDFQPVLTALDEHKAIMSNQKYRNNFDFNHATLIINRIEFLANDCLILTKNKSLASRIGTLHYEEYNGHQDLMVQLAKDENDIQCVVGAEGILETIVVPFGEAQLPGISDYADGIDTMKFLTSLDSVQ